MPVRLNRPIRAVLVVVCLCAGACAPARVTHRQSIADCDYLLVRDDDTHGYGPQARSILSQAFVVLDPYDSALPRNRARVCNVEIRWQRGFWYTPVWVSITDLRSGELILRSEANGPGMWSGVAAAVPLALQDVVAARAAAGPVYGSREGERQLGDSTLPPPGVPPGVPPDAYPPPSQRSKADRLREVEQLRSEGLISEREYEEQRQLILREP